jgi:hypothetical protein
MPAGQIAILEGYQIPRYGKMPRKRKRGRYRAAWRARIEATCKKRHPRSRRKYRACVNDAADRHLTRTEKASFSGHHRRRKRRR